MAKLTFEPANAFRVLVDIVRARMVGFPDGSSQLAMYSGRPMGVFATACGTYGDEMFWGKMVDRMPVLDLARSLRARTVLSFRVGMFSISEAAGERSKGVSEKA